MLDPGRLRIAQIPTLWTSIPPPTYGGGERRVHMLTEELVGRGHEVTLFSTADSVTSARLHPVTDRGLLDKMRASEADSYDPYISCSIAEAVARSDEFDVMHFHVGCASLPAAALSKAPTLHTIPTALTADDLWLLGRYPGAHMTSLSRQQVGSVPESRRRTIETVYNGCDFGHFRVSDSPRTYLAFLGRIAHHKGTHEAIAIARELDLPLVIAGEPLTKPDKPYFEARIKPHIDGERVRYLGAIGDSDKNDLFAGAIACLFPVSWDEPFGIVMIEAMACGVPVVAYPRGAVPEVVDPGITGFYSESMADLVRLVSEAARLEPRAVREHALSRFGHERMVENYLQLYTNLVEAAVR